MAVIDCILIEWVISLLPRGRFERWSWQFNVAALISQSLQFQCLTANVSLIPPVKRVENHGSPYLLSGNSAPVHAICPCMCTCDVTLWQDPGPGMTCLPVGLPSAASREGARRAAVGRIAPKGRTCPQAPGGNTIFYQMFSDLNNIIENSKRIRIFAFLSVARVAKW